MRGAGVGALGGYVVGSNKKLIEAIKKMRESRNTQ
jgi:hypothetical protein